MANCQHELLIPAVAILCLLDTLLLETADNLILVVRSAGCIKLLKLIIYMLRRLATTTSNGMAGCLFSGAGLLMIASCGYSAERRHPGSQTRQLCG